jgi:glutathione synthase/RimK-type ligase-like ATP-grasp enzyme
MAKPEDPLMAALLAGPIGILDEHPEWSRRLLQELDRRGLAWEKIDHSSHAFDPRDRRARHAVIVNRTSPSSHTRGHRGVLFYAEALLAHYESLGIPVVNPVAAYRFEKSKALQLGLFERVGARYPRSLVVNHPVQALAAIDKLRLPVVVKPNVGGSGAGIVRVDSKAELESALGRLDLGPDGTALVQEYLEPVEGAIVRVEVLGGEHLYAIRIVRETGAGFNLCPADICQTPGGAPAPSPEVGACPVSAPAGVTVSRFDAPTEAIETVIRLARAASIDVGGVEYLISKADGRIYYYDVNATSNFVANAEAVVGFDPTARFADFIVRRARHTAQPAAA